MKFYMTFAFLSFFILQQGHSHSIHLKIGCTTKCDPFYQMSLKRAAHIVGAEVKIIDISKHGPKVDWKLYDGVIIPGGADINPQYYFKSIEDDLREYSESLDYLVNYSAEGKKRDPFEYQALKNYFDDKRLKDLPILGICRGMQMLAVSQGVPLYVDIKKELGIRNRRYLFDQIHIEPGTSILNDLFTSSFFAFKRHHQGIRVSYFQNHKNRWPNLEITSYSNNGLIAESIEFANRPILGVQFHPENDFGFENRRIFGWFISKAIERKNN